MKKTFLINLFLFLGLNNAFSTDDRDFSKDHGFLPRDRSYIKTTGEIDDHSFDDLFPYCKSDTEDKGRKTNFSVCQLKTATGLGTATIIENDGKRVTALTAAHVLKNEKGDVIFGSLFQGLSRINDEEETLPVAVYNIDTVCFNEKNKKDIAILKGDLVTSIVDPDELKQYTSKIVSQDKISQDELCTMYHYPLGFSDQRKNVGKINSDGKHSISSLPGSSGASLFNVDGEITCVHNGGDGKIVDRVVYSGNRFAHIREKEKKTFNMYNANLCIPITQIDINDFTTCIKKNDI